MKKLKTHNLRTNKRMNKEDKELTEAVVDEVIEGMAITIISKLVVGSRKLLETLKSNGIEIAAELCVLGQKNSSASHEGVDESLLSHFCWNSNSTKLNSVSTRSQILYTLYMYKCLRVLYIYLRRCDAFFLTLF